MIENKAKAILLIIFIVALVLRLLAVIAQEESKKIPRRDDKQYDAIAVNLLSGNGYSMDMDGQKAPTTDRVPMYPLFLAGIYSIFGHTYIAVKVVQALLGALTCLLIFAITDIVYNNKKLSIIAACITAVYKPFVFGFHYYGSPAVLYSECFYIFIMAAALLTTLAFLKRGEKRLGILSGVLIGMAVLTRPEFALYPVLLMCYLFFISKFSAATFIKRYWIFYLFIMLTIMPWTIRNYVATGHFIPLSTKGGVEFWNGNNVFAYGGWGRIENLSFETRNRLNNLSEYERSRTLLRMGIDELKSNPKRIPKLFVRKALVHWAPFEKGFDMFNAFYAGVLLFSFMGMLFFRKHLMVENILLICFLTTTLVAIIIYGDPRYRHPYESFLIIFAALAIKGIFDFTRKRS